MNPAAAQTSPAVSVTLLAMTPRVPDPAKLTQKVTFTATVSNNSDTAYSDFTVGLERGEPISRQADLDKAIDTPPTTNNLSSSNDVDQKRPLPAHTSVTVRYETNPDSEHMCLCATSVYPFALVIRAQGGSADSFQEVGRTQILVPSFQTTPKPVRVSWIWPLIDRPHRSSSDTVFSDDELAASVSGGRLDRALQVPERTAGKVRMTLLIDPELLDSLAIMARPEGYSYRLNGKTMAGQGGLAAKQWLARLRALVGREDIELTGYADPDVNAATRAGMPISSALDPQVQSRISSAVGTFGNELSWPAGNALTSRALDAVIGAGASTVVLSDAALPGQNSSEPRPDAISPLPSANGNALALVTDSGMERTVGNILRLGSLPAQSQQVLLSQLAIRAVADGQNSHYAVLTPDRYVDTNPSVASATILATVGTVWSRSLDVPTALSTVRPVDRGPLQTGAESPSAEVSATQMSRLVQIESQVRSMREALQSNAAAALLGGFSSGIQRAQSSAWRSDRLRGQTITDELSAAISSRLASVSLVKPAGGTYGLSSSNSPIVVTVENKLSQDVTVEVSVRGVTGVIGFRAEPVQETIPAQGRKTIQVQTHTERVGQFKAIAELTTPDGQALGTPIQLNLRATALGGITKTITIVAASVLVLALLRRVVLRIRHHRRQQVSK
ncbi:MAG: hypothetical protein QOK10_300 [Pseudonocardiales bacterium]|jgi:hypothetical protein|nr:hypothetical protein [Pseudonocardiales bacterium]